MKLNIKYMVSNRCKALLQEELITDMVYASEEQPKVSYSVYISEKLGYNYLQKV